MIATLIVAAPLVAVAGAELGSDAATRNAEAEAIRLRAAGQYPAAFAVNRALAGRTGPLHLLSRGPVDSASAETQLVLIDWANSLASRGDVDQALMVLRGVTQSDLVERARQVRTSVLLTGARRAAAAGQYSVALARLDLMRTESLPTDALRTADGLRPDYEVGAAPALLSGGRAADAVGLLDDAVAHGAGSVSAAVARSMLPNALLTAARQSLDAQYRREAQSLLLRLQYDHPSTREARSARSLLQAPQPVTGTLAKRDGRPVSGPLRLSGHFRPVGNSYLTSGPFYLTTAGANGDFTFDAVPPGGPYVMEILFGGEWTTSIDPETARPANSFSVEQVLPVDLGFVTVP